MTDQSVGLTVHTPFLERVVETYCWVESSETVEERRGDMVRRGTKYNYKSQWCTSYVSSSGFKDPKYRVNEPPNVSNETFYSSSVSVGPYYSVSAHDAAALGKT